jgi:hypothetical protein
MVPAIKGMISGTLYPVCDDGLLWAFGAEYLANGDESMMHSYAGSSGSA